MIMDNETLLCSKHLNSVSNVILIAETNMQLYMATDIYIETHDYICLTWLKGCVKFKSVDFNSNTFLNKL